jgi:competence protein ComEC
LSRYPTAAFGLLQVQCTLGDFEDAIGSPAAVGRWYKLSIGPQPEQAQLPARFAALTPTGFTQLSSGYTLSGSLRTVPGDGDRRPRSLGAAAVPSKPLPHWIVAACSVTASAKIFSHATPILHRVGTASAVRVRDVGQASFASLENDRGHAVLHFDAGMPTAFNGETAPTHLSVHDDRRTPVVLSHWDWDHLHAALQIPALQRRHWIVPDQMIGPGAASLAIGLARRGRLHVWPGGHQSFAFGEIGECGGASRNDSGLALLASLSDNRAILLTGDADYGSLSTRFRRPVDGLVGTHHGARWKSGAAPPRPLAGRASYLLSYGPNNQYGHPHPDSLRQHWRAGWLSPRTTAGRRGQPRGDQFA